MFYMYSFRYNVKHKDLCELIYLVIKIKRFYKFYQRAQQI